MRVDFTHIPRESVLQNDLLELVVRRTPERDGRRVISFQPIMRAWGVGVGELVLKMCFCRQWKGLCAYDLFTSDCYLVPAMNACDVVQACVENIFDVSTISGTWTHIHSVPQVSLRTRPVLMEISCFQMFSKELCYGRKKKVTSRRPLTRYLPRWQWSKYHCNSHDKSWSSSSIKVLKCTWRSLFTDGINIINMHRTGRT